MYLPLKRCDHITDEDGLVHQVDAVNNALINSSTGERMSNAYFLKCRPTHNYSLVGWDYDIFHPEVTKADVTCLACLAHYERT